MSEHKITLEWKRDTESFSYESYNRDHVLVFEGGVRVPASAAPAYRGNPAHVNPEECLVAAFSSCHMLTFLAVAAKKQFVVDRYSDHAVGVLEKNQEQIKVSGTIFASSARAFSSSPGLLSRSVELRPLMGYRFGEDSRIAYGREIGHTYSRPAGSATD